MLPHQWLVVAVFKKKLVRPTRLIYDMIKPAKHKLNNNIFQIISHKYPSKINSYLRITITSITPKVLGSCLLFSSALFILNKVVAVF
jgi:hypothetical protein